MTRESVTFTAGLVITHLRQFGAQRTATTVSLLGALLAWHSIQWNARLWTGPGDRADSCRERAALLGVTMSPNSVDQIATALDDAQRGGKAVAQLDAELELGQAYEVQHALISRRLARGECLVGTKLGFTSKAKMAQMGVSEIIVGQLTDAMTISNAGTVPLARFIHARVEPEVVFRLARDVDTRDPDVDIVHCVDAVAVGLEFIDSRYRDFKFNLADVVADNTSASAYVVGAWQPLPDDLGSLPVRLTIAGEPAEAGSTEALLGHPLNALRELLPMARKYDFPLTAGQVILAGAATAAAPLRPGRVHADIAKLGEVSVQITGA